MARCLARSLHHGAADAPPRRQVLRVTPSGARPAGGNFAFCDGSVGLVGYTISGTGILPYLLKPDDGKVVNID